MDLAMILQGLWWVQGFGSEIRHSFSQSELEEIIKIHPLSRCWQWVPALPLGHGLLAFTFSGVPLNAEIY